VGKISSGEPQGRHDLLMAILIPTKKSVENLVVSWHSLVNGGFTIQGEMAIIPSSRLSPWPDYPGPHDPAISCRLLTYSLGELDGYAKMVGDHAHNIWTELWQYVGYAEGISNFRDPSSPNILCPLGMLNWPRAVAISRPGRAKGH
jgi:hypothetical protein